MAENFVLQFGDTKGGRDTAKRLEGPIHAERHMRIVVIGAGASGLLIAYQLQKHFNNFSLTVYEKNPAVAGTWYENRYPGLVCPFSRFPQKRGQDS
jgi:ribulose 1,5-bisphosphate synthetase/thiazole synthase